MFNHVLFVAADARRSTIRVAAEVTRRNFRILSFRLVTSAATGARVAVFRPPALLGRVSRIFPKNLREEDAVLDIPVLSRRKTSIPLRLLLIWLAPGSPKYKSKAWQRHCGGVLLPEAHGHMPDAAIHDPVPKQVPVQCVG